MNRSKFYKYASIALLILNIVLVSAFFITKPKNRPGGKNRMNIKEHFQMDEAQHDLFLENLELHIEQTGRIRDKQIEILKPYLYSIGDSQMLEEKIVIIDLMKGLEEERLNSLHTHLQGLKSILNEDQVPLFESFLKSKLEEMTSRNQKIPPHRG